MPDLITNKGTKIVFVYSSIPVVFTSIFDLITFQLFKDNTKRQLNDLTKGLFGYKKIWLDFLSQLRLEVEQITYTNFRKKYPKISQIQYPPIIFLIDRGVVVPIAKAENLNNLSKLSELIDYLNKRLHKQSSS